LIPPTTDENLLSHFAQSLTDIQLPTAGNDLAAAIELAKQFLLSSQSHRRLWVLTDGDMETAEQEKVAELFNNERVDNIIQTRFIGIGEPNPVTIPDTAQGLVQFQGRAVLSRIESAWMKQLAKDSAINYQHYRQAQQRSLQDLLQLPAVRLNVQVQQQVLWKEWFSYPLLLGLVCLMLSIFFNSRQLNRPQAMVHSSVLVGLFIFLVGVSLTQSVALADDKTLFKQAQQALQQKNYLQARQLFAQLNSMQGHFGKATACYRMKDYECAKQAFSAAAWLASDDSQRAKAVFNLANSYFFSSDYDQAVVLYRDAELLGLAPELITINRRFAESMQASIQKQIKHIQQNFKRAQWKTAASAEAVPSFSDFLSNDENLLTDETDQNGGQTTYRPSSEIIKNELKRQLGLNNGAANLAAGQWIETDRVLPQSTARMINRLFEMELGIPAKLEQPQLVEGKRAW
ncbi:MAG: hypothetical protein KAU21_12625, partial [Gammaproteobacteria bacterium]|nr:hypothetical protein [Gammaproteobacteria bacterium]